MVFRSSSIALVLVLAAASPALASEAEQEIIVTGYMDGYRVVETTSGTKTKTAILDIPQSIAVVTRQQIDDQAIRSITDLVRLTPGISAGQGEGHRDQVTLRGNNSTADFFVDGLRDDVQYFRSFYNVDRVEILKGPNATIFGRGGGGGVINRVLKGAVEGDRILAGSLAADTFGAWSGMADVNVDFGPAAIRVNGFYESLNNHRDFYNGDSYGITPVIGGRIGETTLQLSYEFVKDDRAIDRGIPSDPGTGRASGTIAAPSRPLAGFRDTFFGVPEVNRAAFEAHVVRFRTETAIGSGLKLSSQALYGDYDKIYTNAFAATAVDRTTAVPRVGIEAYRDPTKRENFIGQTNLEWRVATGPISHVILIGGEFTRQTTDNERINGFFSPTSLTAANRRTFVPLSDPIAIPPISFVRGHAGNSNRAVTSRLRQASGYIQDQITIGNINVIAGLRYDRLNLSVTNVFTNSTVARTDNLWSPRVGLVIKPVPEASIYSSYTRSFLPQSGDQFLTLDATISNLEPEAFDNYEIGAKWDIAKNLTATAAIYQLDRTNTRAAGVLPGTIVLSGKQRTTGGEISLVGRLTPEWQISVGYAHTRARITETTVNAPAGRRVAQVPENQFSLWSRYDVSKRLGFGIGLTHQASQFASISNTSRLPAYTRLDAAVFFKLTDQIVAQVNVENLTDTTYFPVAHNDNNISTGAPINARFTLAFRL